MDTAFLALCGLDTYPLAGVGTTDRIRGGKEMSFFGEKTCKACDNRAEIVHMKTDGKGGMIVTFRCVKCKQEYKEGKLEDARASRAGPVLVPKQTDKGG